MFNREKDTVYEVFLFRNATVALWRHKPNRGPEQSLHNRWIGDYGFGEYERHKTLAVRRHVGHKHQLYKTYQDYIELTDATDYKFWGVDKKPWYTRLFRFMMRLWRCHNVKT